MARDYQQFSPLAAMSYVQQQGDIGRERGQRNQLNQLASQAYTAAPEQRDSLLSQMAGVDAGSAFQAEEQMAYSDERRNTNMVNMAKLLTGAPPEARAGLYRSMVPTLSRFGMSELPQEYTPETAPIIDKAAQSLVQAYQGANATPTDVRSFQMMTAGLSPEQVNDARLVNLGLKGRASNAGYGFFEFDGADGRKRMGRNNPRTGDREVYDEATGDFVPLGGGAGIGIGSPAATQPQAGQHFGDFTSLAGEFPGVTMTSGMRTAERNQQVGGTANSQHLTGTAADYAVPQQLKPAFISRARQMGYQAIDEGDHIHLQLPRGGRAGASAGLAVGRSPEEQAALTEQAKTDVQLRNLPTELNLRTDAALREAGGKAAIETGTKRQAVQAENDRSFNLYDTAMSGVSEGLGNSMTGPLAGRLPAVTAGQQIAEGGVAAIAPVLKQLFRSAGEGTFTDKDQELLLAMIPTRTDLPEARAWKIENIDRIVREKLGQPKKVSQGQPAQTNPSANDFSNLWN